MKLHLTLLYALLVTAAAVNAQEKYTLSGKVTAEKQDSIPAGSVYLLSAKDSSIVKYALLVDGRFTFDPVTGGNYLLRISSMGYGDETRSILLNSNIVLQVKIKTNATALNTVTIAAPKKDFSFKNGDIKINIAGSALAAIPNSVDMLSKLPMVQVSPDGNVVGILGKGNALIYIDRQKASVNELSTLSANDIQDVQIIRNPPAKYEAEGRAVILITRKKDKRDGLQVNLQETASFKRRYSNYTGLNLNYKKKKWELVTSLKYNYRRSWESNEYDFRIKDQDLQTGYSLVSTTNKPECILNTGLHYKINTDDYISLNLNTKHQGTSFPIYTNSYFITPSGRNDVFTTNQSTYPSKYYAGNLNYEKKLKRMNADLFLGSQYANYGEHFITDVHNNYNNTADEYTEHRDQRYDVTIMGGRADLTKSFTNGAKAELGANISDARANAVLNIDNVSPPSHTFSDYAYHETNATAYTQLSSKLKKVSYAIGVRAEYTNVKGGNKDNAMPAVRKRYLQVFPKASLSLPLAGEKSLTLNYGRSITRPGYMSLSQVANYINPYFIWASNIDIDPTTSNDLSANFQWKDKSVNIAWYKRKDPMYPSFTYDTTKTLLTRTDLNYRAETGFICDVIAPFKYKKWSSTNQLSIIMNRISDGAALMGKTKPFVYFYSNQQFKLPEDFAVSVTGWGLTQRYEGAFERNALMQVDTSITKTFASKLVCTLSWNDIFKTINPREDFVLNGVSSRGLYYDNVREVSIAVRYSFGTTRESKYRNKNVDGNLNRL